MALVIITGYPFSGKTYRARQLAAALEERISSLKAEGAPRNLPLKVVHVTSDHATLDQTPLSLSDNLRDTIYGSVALEKTARAREIGTVKRALNRDSIVIADSLNYIKGYRYQLWCEAKAAGVRCLTVHTAVPQEDCREWNCKRRRGWGWSNGTVPGEEPKRKKLGDVSLQSHTTLYGDTIPDDENESPGVDTYPSQIRPLEPPDQSLHSLYLRDSIPAAAQQSTPDAPPQYFIPSQSAGSEQPAPSAATAVPFPTEPPYSPSVLTALLMRYEPPSPFSRWDTPLYSVLPTDRTPPVAEIWSTIFPSSPSSLSSASRAVPEQVIPHAATVAPKATAAESLQIIERRTNTVLSTLAAWARDHSDEGGEVVVLVDSTATTGDRRPEEGSSTEEKLTLRVPYGTNVNMAAGQRLRRRYVQMQRGAIAHGQKTVGLGMGEVERGFVRWLEGEWGVDS